MLILVEKEKRRQCNEIRLDFGEQCESPHRLKTILMSVAVTQSCSTGLLSKSYAEGRPSRVLKATREPEMGSVFESAHSGSCSLAVVQVTKKFDLVWFGDGGDGDLAKPDSREKKWGKGKNKKSKSCDLCYSGNNNSVNQGIVSTAPAHP